MRGSISRRGNGYRIRIYLGQLKEVREDLDVGAIYEVGLRPFVNNRWVDLKIVSLSGPVVD